jgi:hypothetical protein
LSEKAVSYLRQAGVKAAARSALADARSWFEQALDALAALPESQATREQAFEIRLELSPVLSQLGEVRRSREPLLQAAMLAGALNDDHPAQAPKRWRSPSASGTRDSSSWPRALLSLCITPGASMNG